MKYGYIRVSSKSQEQNTSLTQQRADVIAAGAEMVVEEVFSGGTVANRPQFSEMIAKLRAGDELIVTKLDRFARTVSEGSSLAQRLYNNGITLSYMIVPLQSLYLKNSAFSVHFKNFFSWVRYKTQ